MTRYLYSSSFPPQNYVAEEILLGATLINPVIFSQIVLLLREDCFFLESHRLIYRNLIFIYSSDQMDSLHLFRFLSKPSMLELPGGPCKIIELMKQGHMFMSSAGTSHCIQELILIINNNYTRRLMIQYGYNIISLASISKLPCYQLHSKASEYLKSVIYKMPKENLTTFKDLLSSLLVKLKHRQLALFPGFQALNHLTLFGFYQLDQLIPGLHGGDLIVIAGRPSVGKTSFVINVAFNILRSSKVQICFFSLEISKMQIVQKLLAIASNTSAQDISLGKIAADQWFSISQICNELMNYDIYINDAPNTSIHYIQYTLNLFLVEAKNTGLVIIDYLQLIQVENFNSNLRSQELSFVTRRLKLLAQNLHVPILVLSQLNRNIETRVNKKPLLSDLRESGCLSESTFLNADLDNSFSNKNFYDFKIFRQQKLVNASFDGRISGLIHADSCWKIMLQYVFYFLYNKNSSILTHNHRIYSKQKWITQGSFLEEDNCTLNNWLFDVSIVLEIFHVPSVRHLGYLKVYDLQNLLHSILLSNNLLLHNSIEQDSDIVIILSKQEDTKLDKFRKIINLSVCKNRNGPTGACQLLFVPENNAFSNL